MAVSDFESISDLNYAYGVAHTPVTAGGANNATNVAGAILDRASYSYAQSAALLVPYICALSSGKKLSLVDVFLEHGDNSALSDAANFSVQTNADVSVEGTSANYGCKEYSVHVGSAKRYLRWNVKAALSNATVDTASFCGVAVFGFGKQST